MIKTAIATLAATAAVVLHLLPLLVPTSTWKPMQVGLALITLGYRFPCARRCSGESASTTSKAVLVWFPLTMAKLIPSLQVRQVLASL